MYVGPTGVSQFDSRIFPAAIVPQGHIHGQEGRES